MLECMSIDFFFFFFKQKTAYEMLRSLVGSEMCIRDRLNHMLTHAKRRLPQGERLRPSAYLAIEMTDDQQMLLDPTPEDLIIGNVLNDAGGDGAIKKLAQRKLDDVGFVNAHCCHANTPNSLDRIAKT
eukprot:TRINITY_DN14732_c0_g1_i1.p1 TRINITY_DN14732_c0_g1~~TRINITY_DN14732_c0_g1_i1.p1  ORF type:complete len:128 (-),score=38.41 TRINITY_DN14732_c0_g1_i1:391-774(-)